MHRPPPQQNSGHTSQYRPRQYQRRPRFYPPRSRTPGSQQPHTPYQPHHVSPSVNRPEFVEHRHLDTNSFECMICCEYINLSPRVQSIAPVWSCERCYNIFHLKCAKEWCKKSLQDRNAALNQTQEVNQPHGTNHHRQESNRYASQRMQTVEWACPACRGILTEIPVYKCWCGKMRNPEYQRYLAPHSCGEVCSRKRPDSDCPHTCNIICHPNRCAPCPLTSRKSCPCGKKTQEMRCSEPIGTCEGICDKLLACNQHRCTKVCHTGACGECQESLEVKCHCGTQTKTYNCAQLATDPSGRKSKLKPFSCENICNIKLDCGQHSCQKICHPGPCPTCPLSNDNVTTCPCGSRTLDKSQLDQRQSCLDPIPCCKNGRCNELLTCGGQTADQRHKCQANCHNGECPVCPLKTVLRCECKSNTKTILCSELLPPRTLSGLTLIQHTPGGPIVFKCTVKCNKTLNCGKHRCQRMCCTSKFCETKNSEVSSYNHQCDKVCGRKLECGRHVCQELCHSGSCGDCPNIGWEELRCHCGSSVLYPPIPCGTLPPACNCRCVRRHTCSHPVNHECHSENTCPPCTHFVTRRCYCGAEAKDSVFCYAPGYSCGKSCKKFLPCGVHTCQLVCHEGDCIKAKDSFVCRSLCPVKRYSCGHPCNLQCHGKSSCPFSECKRLVDVTCPCGLRKEQMECFLVTRDLDNRAKMAALSMAQRNQDIVINLKHSTEATSPNRDDTVRLECDEACAKLKRQRELADAFGITNPDLETMAQSTSTQTTIDESLKELVSHDYKFASETFRSLVRFVQTAKESNKRFLFLKFPPANRCRRDIIEELASHFACTAESHDEEPFRHVVVRAYKSKSSIPEFTIEQLAPSKQ